MKKIKVGDDLVVIPCEDCGHLFSKYELFEDEDGNFQCKDCKEELEALGPDFDEDDLHEALEKLRNPVGAGK